MSVGHTDFQKKSFLLINVQQIGLFPISELVVGGLLKEAKVKNYKT